TPLSITVHKVGNHFIVDPNVEEEDTSETRVTVGSADGVIFSMQKGENSVLEVEDLEKILDIVEKVWKTVYSKTEKNLK
ncbi:MAG: hypothetical protein AABX28_03395, partial [Nanoarchaeota archaeon]